MGARPEEIVFTGGGTEASNHAIRGFAAVAPPGRRHIVTSTVEHPATRIGVDGDAVVDLVAALRVLRLAFSNRAHAREVVTIGQALLAGGP